MPEAVRIPLPIEAAFADAIADAGLTPPGDIMADGNIHRFSTNGRAGDTAGWYALHSDHPAAGAFGCWRSGISHKWCAIDQRSLSTFERNHLQHRLEQAKARAEADRKERHASAAKRAMSIWQNAVPASGDHPYLVAKKVQPLGLRQDDDSLLVPIHIDGQLTSLQTISPDGQKRFMRDGEVKSGLFRIGGAAETPVVIVEGFATGASISEATGWPVVVAFDAGNLEPVAKAIRAMHPNAQIIIGADNDQSGVGQDKSKGAANAVGGTVALPPGADTDWNDFAGLHGLEAVKAQFQTVCNAVFTKAGPQPSAWPAPLDGAAYHGLAGELVRTIDLHTEADPVAILVQFLTAFGNAVGRGPHFLAEADRHGCNLNAVCVGETSKGRKGTSWGQAKRPVEMAVPEWAARVVSGLSSGEGLIWQVRDPIEKQEPIKDKKRVVGYETVTSDQGVADKRLLVFEGELASALRVLAREGNTLSAVIRNAWDTGTLSSLTKNSPARATGAHISIIGHITRDELLRYLADTEAGNGFANRFLWVCVKRSKLLPDGGSLQADDLVPLADQVGQALIHAHNTGLVTRDEEARAIWHSVYPVLSEGKPGLLGAVTARAEAQVMRLALIYALLDSLDEIRAEHLRAALALWEYSEASATFIFGDRLGDPIADTIMGALQSQPEGLTRTKIRDLFQRNASATRIEAALDTLAKAGKVSRVTDSTGAAGGRPAERWVLSFRSFRS